VLASLQAIIDHIDRKTQDCRIGTGTFTPANVMQC